MSYNGPLLTRSFGPNFKGTKLSILEMDNNLLYLEELAKTQIGANYAQTVGTQVIGITSSSTIVEVEIETNGYPVQVTVTGDADPTGGVGNWCQLQLYKNGSPIGNIIQAESSANGENIPFTVNYIDSPTAGTYTYTLEVVDISGEFRFGEVSGPVITAIELANKNWVQTVATQSTVVPVGNDAQLVQVEITTTGAPIQIMVTGDANPTPDPGFCRLRLFRNNVPIGNSIQAESSLANENIPYALNFIDEVPSGTYSYSLRVTQTSGSTFSFGEVNGPVMTAVELVSGGDNWNESDNSVVDSVRSNSKGGECNVICSSVNSTIIGGNSNEICGSGSVCDSGIFGGCRNTICGSVDYSAIVGGAYNLIYGDADAGYSACDSAIMSSKYTKIENSNQSGIISSTGENCYASFLCNSNSSSIISSYKVGLGYSNRSSVISSYFSGIVDACSSVLLGTEQFSYICNSNTSVIIAANEGVICFSQQSAIIGGSDSNINYSNRSTIIGSINSYVVGSTGSMIIGGSCNSIVNTDDVILTGSCNHITCSSYSSILSGCDNCLYFVNSSNIIGGSNNNINYSNRSTIIGSIDSCVVGSTGSMIIGGSCNSIANTDDVILIPTLTTSTFSAGNFDKWKLGKTASGPVPVALDTAQYIEVEINGIVYKLGVVS